jgi:hypothetical protein
MKDCTSNNYLVPMAGKKQFLLSMESPATLKFHPSLFRYICFTIIYVESPALACVSFTWELFLALSHLFNLIMVL